MIPTALKNIPPGTVFYTLPSDGVSHDPHWDNKYFIKASPSKDRIKIYKDEVLVYTKEGNWNLILDAEKQVFVCPISEEFEWEID